MTTTKPAPPEPPGPPASIRSVAVTLRHGGRPADARTATNQKAMQRATTDEIVSRAARQPQHLLVTLFGDFWLGRGEALPSTALVRLLGEFGVSEVNARAALSRLARKDLLAATRHGRRTAYALTPYGHQTLRQGTRRIFNFMADRGAWDGKWTLISFSVPEKDRSLRGAFRTRLRWLGFAPMMEAVWVAPRDLRPAAIGLVEELAIPTSAIMYGEISGRSAADLANTWSPDAVGRRYDEFLTRFGPIASRITSGSVDEAHALLWRTALMDEWRAFPALDPELPADLLPDAWPALQAQQLFERVYDGLGLQAEARVRALIAVDDTDVAHLSAVHTVEEGAQY